MKPSYRAADNRLSFSIRMTPLIDVIFLLMIFFLITISFQDPEGVLKNRLPESGGQGVTEKEDWEVVRLRIKLIIREGEQPTIYLQERLVSTFAELLYYLNQLPEDILLVIEPESKVLYKDVIAVYNTCVKAQKKNIVFAIAPG